MTQGNALNFGTFQRVGKTLCGWCFKRETRGIFGGGVSPAHINDDKMEYITIASAGQMD